MRQLSSTETPFRSTLYLLDWVKYLFIDFEEICQHNYFGEMENESYEDFTSMSENVK